MALPKEPRQKMINMMYLVLTALLALNVSAEILNAFKTVNTSIGKSNQVITEKNDLTYNSFKAKLNDPQTKVNAEVWAPKAFAAQKLSGDLYTYLDNLKLTLKKESGLEVSKEGEESYREADLDAPTRLMDEHKEGTKLYDALKDYRQKMLDILNPQELQSINPTWAKEAKEAQEEFSKELPLDLTIPKSQSGNADGGGSVEQKWTTSYFHMTPTIAALTILSKFQNDVKNSESMMVDFCHKKIGEVKVVFDQFQALAQASSNYLMSGDKLTITAGVGAFSAQAKPKIFINGELQPLQADGTAEYNTTASGAGDKTVDVRIEYTKPDGSPAVIDKPVKYTVGIPSGASVFLEKMNVVYVGVDNPLTISGGSVGSEKVHVNFTSPGASLTHTTGDHYIIKPTTPGEAQLIVTANGKPFPFPIRVKQLPLPAGFVGTRKGGAIPAAEFKADGGLIARLEESDFEAHFKVESYTVGFIGGSFNAYQQTNNEGNRFAGRTLDLVGRATPGTNIFFDNIKVTGPDGKPREIAPMVFSLK
jgi:gliding motility-associated protein GldM